MNINVNELLVMKNKKMGKVAVNNNMMLMSKFENPTDENSQIGMKSLMFKGMNNVASTPNLATKLGKFNEEGTNSATNDEKQEYVAPYKSNLAFQGKMNIGKNKLLKAAIITIAGLAVASCKDGTDGLTINDYSQTIVSNNTTVNITADMTKVETLLEELVKLQKEELAKQGIRDEEIKAFQEAMLNWMARVENMMTTMGKDSKEFQDWAKQAYGDLFKQLLLMDNNNNANFTILATLIAQNGKTLEEAKAYLAELVNDVRQGFKTADEAMRELIGLVYDIKAMVSQALSYLERAEKDRANLFNFAKQATGAVLGQGQILIDLGRSLLESSYKANDRLNVIADELEQAKLDNNARLDEIARTINVSKTELINVLMQLGYKQAQIEMMNTAQIIAAIRENTKATQSNGEQLRAILERLDAGIISVEDAAKEILSILGDIKSMIASAIESAEGFKQELLRTLYEIRNSSYTSNAQNSIIIQQNAALIASNNALIKEVKSVREAIEKASVSNDAKLDEIAKSINIAKVDIINMMMYLGYTQAQIEAMNTAQIIAAIKEGTKQLEETNGQLQGVNDRLDRNDINAQQAADEILSILGEINEAVNQISTTLTGMSDTLNALFNEVKGLRRDLGRDMARLIMNNEFQTSVLLSMKSTQEKMAKDVKAIKNNTNELLDMAQNHHAELMEAIRNIEQNGATSIDYKKLEEMFKLLNMNLTNVLNMNQAQLIAAIKDFQKTYVETEAAQAEELAKMNEKLEDLMIFQGLAKDELKNAINGVTDAINNGKDDITNEIKIVEAQLEKLQAAVNAIYKKIGREAINVNSALGSLQGMLRQIMGMMHDFGNKANLMLTYQKVAANKAQEAVDAINALKDALKEYEGATGNSSITKEEMDELMAKHDAENFARYSELIKSLGLGSSCDHSTIEELLRSIDGKMDGIQQNTNLLGQILNLLQSIDWTKPDYSDKLDAILDRLSNIDWSNPDYTEILNKIYERMEKYEHNCNCGNPDEGIIGDLDDILGLE